MNQIVEHTEGTAEAYFEKSRFYREHVEEAKEQPWHGTPEWMKTSPKWTTVNPFFPDRYRK